MIAGATLSMEEANDKKYAYLGGKFVKNEYRGKGIGPKLVEARLAAAKQEGCDLAYCMVRKQNIPALRSIVKSGFEIRSVKDFDPEYQFYGDYYVVKDLKRTTSGSDVARKQMTIPVADEQAIEAAFAQGFVGKDIVIAKDAVQKPLMYLEKSPSKIKTVTVRF